MMDKPKRIQRKRIKGWKMPGNTVYVGRPTKWGNPFRVGQKNPFGTITADNRHAYSLFVGFAPQNERLIEAARKELRGKDVACWCPLDQPCHADVILEIANEKIKT